VRYGEVTPRARLLEVGWCEITVKDGSDEYGLLDGARLPVAGIVKRVELASKQTENGIRLTWSLVDVQDPEEVKAATDQDVEEFRREQFENIYLDTSETELGPALCVPVGHDYEDYLECLLLRPCGGGMEDVKRGEFQRIGMVRVPSYHRAVQVDLVKKHKGNEPCCQVECCDWDPAKSMHWFVLV
jgi:hypothetical protein